MLVALAIVCVLLMPVAAWSRPSWGPAASLTFLGLLLMGAGFALAAVPARNLPDDHPDGGTQ